MVHAAYEGGFANSVLGSQGLFRTLMDAMARPGTVHPVTTLASPPAGLNSTAGAILLSLCDADTSVWLTPDLARNSEVREWLGFHAGAPVTGDKAAADFAVIADPCRLLDLGAFALGTQEYPDRSTTLIIAVEALTGGDLMELEGPGIDGRIGIAPKPLPPGFTAQWAANRARFPRGIDLIFAAPDAIACMPRSSRIINQPGV
ncbi:alpha-D-ribose 1-methylphosphonate 5-triphosphate synthase subunit PhnH [Hoeflea marina]|uniref:Alpha-D-ribose 1-methylphosphonate 5-triphosphate synthase subunit PhnH n=1 Tax=Hoeflea marina TaxID=274592 RepID=A0A317PFB5_9HYPH|nr:phosphonate C-P lyase system protein PhnH [Hoeflea marina]PWV98891.1 alpha-D-ribose 1-methylphosphonate 5-triphosphate synthase subunit PhnH [Hoeflea marina]